MKKLALVFITIVSFTGMVNAQDNQLALFTASKPAEVAAFDWDKTTFQFGKVPQGKPVTVKFSFVNKGNAPLIITKVNSPCGCTVPDYTKESILPGKKGYVTLTYNAAAVGTFNKSVTVLANTLPESTILTISGEVTNSVTPENK